MAQIAIPSALSKFKSLRSRDNLIAASITTAALLLFVVTASQTTGPAIEAMFATGGHVDKFAAVSLLLNVALILFVWKRQKEVRTATRQQAKADRRAHLLKTRDLHTELLNRRALRDRGSELIARTEATGGNIALMVINLIRFKKVNEVYGDEVGDELLRVVAGIILGAAPKGAICGRLGNDEFAVATAFRDDGQGELIAFAQAIHASLTAPIEVMGATLQVRAAIGLSRLEADCPDFSALLRRADIAMHAARDAEGVRPIWFEARMERAVRERNEIELGLRRGIPLGEFVPYYQPQVEFASGRIRGFEMLARWNHPTDGVIGPDVFVPIAEETGLIGPLSESMMRLAFHDAAEWDPGLMLSVNISPRQLADPWLAQKVIKLLAETGFPPQRLELEITESSLFENLEVARSVIVSLKNQGITLALDDFGTGYSSLAHLRALPFDRIKIDRSFVQSLNKEPESWKLVKAIVNLGESLGLPITAEGVESGAIEIRLRELRCELGQGWFFGRALPADGTADLLAEHGLLAGAGRGGPAADSDCEDWREARSAA
jgi:diguanylate cyclase (GGDEF)-like protein